MNLLTAERHPLSAIFGDMSEEEYRDLGESVDDIGYADPYIVFLEGKVFDGWNRLCYAREKGIVDNLTPIEYGDVYDKGTEPDAVKYVLAKNLTRRHLSASKRATIVAQLVTWRSDQGHANDPSAVSLEDAAKLAGVSPPTMSDAKRVVDAGKAGQVLEDNQPVSTVAAGVREEEGKKKPGRPKKTKDDPLTIAANQIANTETERDKALEENVALKRRQTELEQVIAGYEADAGQTPSKNVQEVLELQSRVADLEGEVARLTTKNAELTKELAALRRKKPRAPRKNKEQPAS